MSIKRILGVWIAVAFLALSAATPASLAAVKVPPVTNLRVTGGGSGSVTLQWNAPSLPPSAKTTIDHYVIKRDGKQIVVLDGWNGQVDTTYVDGTPSNRQATYTVTAEDTNYVRSSPVSVNAPAPQGAAPPNPVQQDKTQQDGIQSSDLCTAIVPPDVRGGNSPTPLEVYGCGRGMNTVNDSGPSHVNLLLVHPAVPRPIHDFFQSVFIQFPITLGQMFFLLISALSIWVMNPYTYLDIAHLFGAILQIFHGNAAYPALVAFAIGVGVLSIGRRMLKDEHREGFRTVAIILGALTVLAVFLSSPMHTMRFAVEKPMEWYSEIVDTVTEVTAGTNVSTPQAYGLTVVPTYGGDKLNSTIRKDENTDWLIFQYLPQCAINFDDFRWAMFHDVPGTHTSFCERFVQVSGKGSNDDKKKFTDDVKKSASNDVYTYFQGNDQMGRVGGVVVSKITLTVHHIMKTLVRLSVFACEFLLLGELLFAALWIIFSMLGTDDSRFTAERRIRTMLHWIKVPSILLMLGLFEQVVEANVIAHMFNRGFIVLSGLSLGIELIMLYALWKLFRKMQHDHQAALERLGAVREKAGSWAGRALKWGAAAYTAGAGAEFVRERSARKKGRDAEGSVTDGPSVARYTGSSDFGGFHPPETPLIEARTSRGNGGQRQPGPQPPPGGNGNGRPYDADGYAEDLVPMRELVSSTSASSNGQGSQNGGPPHLNGGNPSLNGHRTGRYDGETYDADVVDDEPPSGGFGNDFRATGDDTY